jgi:hypothetical protein
MKFRLGRFKSFILIAVFILVIYVIVPSVNYTNCVSNNRFQNLTIDGVVVKKYLDKSQHSTPIVEVQNFLGCVDKIYLYGDGSGLYERIQLRTVLKKERGSNEVLIKEENRYVRLGIANFNCDSVKLADEKFLFWIYDLLGTVPSDKTQKDCK